MTRAFIVFLEVLVLGLLTSCSAGKRTAPPPPPKLDCDGFKSEIWSIWNGSAREDLNLTLKVYQGELDAAGAEQIVRTITTFSNNWVTQRKSSCDRQNSPDRLTEEEYSATVDCLESAVTGFKTSIEAFKAGEIQAFENVLYELDDCM